MVSSANSSPSATAILQFIGDYVVVKKIGEGGMGAVYLAEDTKLHRKAAVKTMRRELASDPSNRERFLREARAAAAVEHDNIVPIWQIGESADGSPFIAMPFLQGEPLDARLKRQPLPGLGLVVKVAREVADALAAAHAHGLIHRDIKPANVWLEGDSTATDPTQQVRRCKVLDFGLARSTEREDGHLTASGAILGTPAYMAPEQARGEKADHRADLWSLGVMLYRIATGEMPFKGSNTMAILTELATKTPSSSGVLNPNLPPEVAALIDQLMCKDPAGRPKSAAEVAATVRQIVKNLQAKRGSANPAASAISAPQPATGVVVGSLDLDDIAKSAAPSQSAAPAPVPPVPPPASTSVPPPASRAWEEVTEAEAVAKPKTPPSARPKAPTKMPKKAPAKAMEPEEPEAKSPKRKPAPKVTAKSAGKRGGKGALIAAGVAVLLAVVAGAVVVSQMGKKKEPEAQLPGAGTTGGEKGKSDPKGPNAPAGPLPGTFTNGIGMEFVKVPKGTGWLGGGGGRSGNTKVVIEQDFYLGKYEVTQGEWETITGLNPSVFNRGNVAVKDISDAELKRFPVEQVSWDDCQVFIERLNKREKESDWVYRLPKESEWEYACRGGPVDKLDSAFDFYFAKPTNLLLPEQANFNNVLKRTCKVGSYEPNLLGLYDMHGNAHEWCDDAEKAADGASRRVGRGGGWGFDSGYCRAARRLANAPSYRGNDLGLRLARVPSVPVGK